MSAALRYALYLGLALTVVALGGRLWRYRGFHFPAMYFLEALGLAVMPLPVPLFLEIIGKATQSARLPIFNDAEHRVALVIGAAVLLLAIFVGIFAGIQRAFQPAPVAAAGALSSTAAATSVVPSPTSAPAAQAGDS